MQVGIMSGHFQRPTLEESLDAILGHDIRHLQFNPGSVNVQGRWPISSRRRQWFARKPESAA